MNEKKHIQAYTSAHLNKRFSDGRESEKTHTHTHTQKNTKNNNTNARRHVTRCCAFFLQNQRCSLHCCPRPHTHTHTQYKQKQQVKTEERAKQTEDAKLCLRLFSPVYQPRKEACSISVPTNYKIKQRRERKEKKRRGKGRGKDKSDQRDIKHFFFSFLTFAHIALHFTEPSSAPRKRGTNRKEKGIDRQVITFEKEKKKNIKQVDTVKRGERQKKRTCHVALFLFSLND